METAFYKNYIELCRKAGKSPSAVAIECGLSRGSATTWKSGTLPRNETMIVIADYFHVTVEDLLREDAESTPTPAADLTDTEQMVLNLWRKVPEDKRPQVLMEYMAMLKDKGLL